jgi:hypothetical protein
VLDRQKTPSGEDQSSVNALTRSVVSSYRASIFTVAVPAFGTRTLLIQVSMPQMPSIGLLRYKYSSPSLLAVHASVSDSPRSGT